MKIKKTVAVSVLLAVCALSAFGQLKKATPIPRKSSGGGGGYAPEYFSPRVDPIRPTFGIIPTAILEDQTRDGDIIRMQNGDLYLVADKDQSSASMLFPLTKFYVANVQGGVLLIVQSSSKVIHAKLLDPD